MECDNSVVSRDRRSALSLRIIPLGKNFMRFGNSETNQIVATFLVILKDPIGF